MDTSHHHEVNGQHDVNYIPVSSFLGWDEYFMLLAITASLRSKDPKTKVGCVIVDEDNHQVGMGYNGFIPGIDETRPSLG